MVLKENLVVKLAERNNQIFAAHLRKSSINRKLASRDHFC